MGPKKGGRPKRGAKIAAIVGAVIALLLVIVWFVVIPQMIASKVDQAAKARALDIKYRSSGFRFSYVVLEGVEITPRGNTALHVKIPKLQVDLDGTKPLRGIVPSADIAITGTVDEVVTALHDVKEADAKLPPEQRIDIDLRDATVSWSKPFGDGSKIKASKLALQLRPKESKQSVQLSAVSVQLQRATIAPLEIKIDRVAGPEETIDVAIDFAPKEEGDGSLLAHRGEGADHAELTFHALSLHSLSVEMKGLDLKKATVDGSATFDRSSEGAVKSKGKIVIAKLRLPSVKVGPVTVTLGTSARLSWKGSPKKGEPGTMKLDEAKLEVDVGGKLRTVNVSGDVSVGEHGEGPYLLKLAWSTVPIECSEIAGDLAGGGLTGGLAKAAVSGTIAVTGTIKADLGALDDAKQTLSLNQACKIDLDPLKGLGELPKLWPPP